MISDAGSVGHEFPETRLNIMSLIFGTVLPWLLIAVGGLARLSARPPERPHFVPAGGD